MVGRSEIDGEAGGRRTRGISETAGGEELELEEDEAVSHAGQASFRAVCPVSVSVLSCGLSAAVTQSMRACIPAAFFLLFPCILLIISCSFRLSRARSSCNAVTGHSHSHSPLIGPAAWRRCGSGCGCRSQSIRRRANQRP